MSQIKTFFGGAAIFLSLCAAAFSQSGRPQPSSTPPDSIEKVATEEIKLNVLAFDDADNFARNLKPEDLVINEDGRLHQATSVRRIPANVLLVLDVGNEISYAKRNRATAETARGIVGGLQETDAVAVMQYGDKVEVLSDWTRDRTLLAQVLNERKLGFGRRSVFVQAMNKAIEFFDKTPLENRHLILISDGVDSFNDKNARDAATKKLLSSDINVHVISYTKLQQAAIGTTKSASGGGTRPKPLPPGAAPPHAGETQTFPIATVNLDREMMRKRREQTDALKTSEQYLTTIAEDTNGEIFLPDSVEEMVEKTATLAKNIDSQYVVTYTPKRALNEASEGETRTIEVTSRRAGMLVQGRRKFVVTNK